MKLFFVVFIVLFTVDRYVGMREDGTVVAGAEGAHDGVLELIFVGENVGIVVAVSIGINVGTVLGCKEGREDGIDKGIMVGSIDGIFDGYPVGWLDGTSLGDREEGNSLGASLEIDIYCIVIGVTSAFVSCNKEGFDCNKVVNNV
jgi:hypothetical protein